MGADSEKEMLILVIGELAWIYKTNLIDLFDQSPCIIKTSLRLIEIIHKYFKTTNYGIMKGCSVALLNLDKFCLYE